MTNGMTVISPGTGRLGGGAQPTRRLGAAAALDATPPSASSFIGRNTAAPRVATNMRPNAKSSPPCPDATRARRAWLGWT
jgi:hypothetical protein